MTISRGGATTVRTIVGFAIVAPILVGCGSLPFGEGDEVTQNPETTPETSPDGVREISEYELQVGDCILDAIDDPFPGGVTVVPCSDPHQQEVFAAFHLEGAEFPGEEEVRSEAEAGCRDEFHAFTGVEYDQSRFFLNFLYPTDVTWEGGDREVVCMIYDEAGEKTGTLHNVGE